MRQIKNSKIVAYHDLVIEAPIQTKIQEYSIL